MPVIWTDRAGRFSALKFATFWGCCLPMLWLGWLALAGQMGSKPLTFAIHDTGDWAVRWLLISLAVTPLRSIGQWPRLILIRRMLGLTALAYVLVHLALYVVEQRYDLVKVASEIILRFYLTIGFVALVGLAVLGATSTDRMIRRLGSVRWNRLHAMVYGLAVLSLWHFFLQSKLDVTQPVLMAGFFLWLMGYRLMRRVGVNPGALALTGLALASGMATALVEAAWYATMTGAMAWRVLVANLDVSFTIRPALWITAAGMAVVALCVLRHRNAEPARRRTGAAQPVPSSTHTS
jgi:methionine sulfoxide reductase heme-binding subunit